MKRAETIAWSALAGLLVMLALLVIGGFAYHFAAFWAGALLAGGQALAVALAAWGLMLARQARELAEVPAATTGSRMRAGEDTALRAGAGLSGPASERQELELASKTLDTGFQRLLVAATGIVMTGLGVGAGWLLFAAYRWSSANPDQPLVIAGPYDIPEGGKALFLDERGLLIGVAAAAIYGVLYWLSRPRRDAEGLGEATSSTLALGITGMAAVGAATVLGYFRFSWASELAAGVVACFLVLEGLELLVNALRSYSSIEEMDQEAVDLQATPLGPMLGSIWLAGLRMLFAQSVGLSREGRQERGVVARLMPRVLAALVLIAIGASCFRVVEPGTVAVLERMGDAPMDAGYKLEERAILQPGLHVTLPWPIDQLVVIPTEKLQVTEVGTELHSPKAWKGVDFQFWTVRGEEKDDIQDMFLTGDPGAPQALETFVQVRWRVRNPAHFYSVLSHSDFFKRGGGTEADKAAAKSQPIYEAIVQEYTSLAVTRTFAIHSLEQIMVDDRKEVEDHCRRILQDELDALGKPLGLSDSGIEVAYMTIKDLHPPYWRPDRYDPSQPPVGGRVTFAEENGRKVMKIEADNSSTVARGPASAFEFVISMREFYETLVNLANAQAIGDLAGAKGFTASEVNKAYEEKADKVAKATGAANRLVQMMKNLDPKQRAYELKLMEQQLLYSTMKELMDPVTKIVVDPAVKDVEIYQPTDKNQAPLPRAN
jgi:regulator of protease activity HflC (stomatin/prohibitin superfamily)